MSTEIETTDQDDSETNQASLATFQEPPATMDFDHAPENVADDGDIDDDPENVADEIDLDEPGDQDDGEEADAPMGEWSLCASMIFFAGYLVVLMLGVLGHPVWKTIVSFEWEVYRTQFPVGVATILLLISGLSAFCSFMSLVADKNNRQALLIRLVTLGPLLPTATAGFMIYIIIHRGAGNSILENFLG